MIGKTINITVSNAGLEIALMQWITAEITTITLVSSQDDTCVCVYYFYHLDSKFKFSKIFKKWIKNDTMHCKL